MTKKENEHVNGVNDVYFATSLRNNGNWS